MGTLLSAFLTCFLFASAAPSECAYDKSRYDEIRSVIDSSDDKMLKMPFDDAAKLLGLENVQWDKAYTNAPDSEERLYHFRGSYLLMHITRRMPDNPPVWTSEDLEKRGRWYVYYFYPSVHIDCLTDPERRMRNYWDALEESFRRRNEEMKKNPTRNQRKLRRRTGSSH